MRYAQICVNTPTAQYVGRLQPSEGGAKDAPAVGVPAAGVPTANEPGPDDDPGKGIPLTRTFTYAVPDPLIDRLQPGHLVWARFGSQRVQGIVMSLSDDAPDFKVRDVEALVWAQPLLTPVQLELAPWISDTYLAPLIESLRLMLPAGLTQRGRTIYVRTAIPAPDALTERQRALLESIAAAPGEWSEVSRGAGRVTQADDLEPLIKLRLVSRETEFPAPPPRPKTDRQVRLLVDAAGVERALTTLGRASKPADALAWLAGHGGAASQEELAAAGVGRPTLKTLTDKGLVRQEVAGGPPGSVETGSVGTGSGSQPVPGGPGSVPVPGKARFVLSEPAAVGEAIAVLRGTTKHRAVLFALLRHEGPAWIGWVYAETGATIDTLRDLEAAGLISLAEEVIWRDPLAGQEFIPDRPPRLNEDQERAVNALQVAGGTAQPPAALLYGVTGSGKTEVYLRAIEAALAHGKQAIVLVPEIALTPQTIRRFAARFPGKVTVWHSELSDGERFDVWRRVRTRHPAAQVIVGSRSALFLPCPELGLIVVDEEHEPSYKQERTPRYHARAVALALGRLARVPVILGSATPALETYYAAKRGELLLLTLPRRVIGHRDVTHPNSGGSDEVRPDAAHGDAGAGLANPAERPLPLFAGVGSGILGSAILGSGMPELGDLPDVTVVDMRHELRVGNRSMFSRALAAGLRHVLSSGQQAIIYLNRRGAATYVFCRDCGYVAVCQRCATPLTFHGQSEQLVCHQCNRRYPPVALCPKCRGPRIRQFGVGTERVQEAVALEFPGARTLRWDRDVTGARGSHDAILSRFIAHDYDILIGTQMIAKGLDLPLVTLVGVVAADTNLYLPDFRSAERTFQLLTQVAGRAGRSALGGQVVVQTYQPEHYAIRAAADHDYEQFYREEMGFRREQGYPPVRRLAQLVYHHADRSRAQAEAQRLAKILQAEITARGLADTDLIGPAPAYFSKQRDEYRWYVAIRSPEPALLLRPLLLGRGTPLAGWRVDIDPVDML